MSSLPFTVLNIAGSENPGFLKKSPTGWFWGFIGFWALLGFFGFLAHSIGMSELMQSRGVRRPSVCLSVNFYRQVATSTTNMTRSPANLHTMVPTWACIQGVLKVKVKAKGHVIWTLFWCDENRFFYHKHDWIASKLTHDGPHMGLHPGCAQGQGQGQRSRDTGTSVMSRNVCYTVPSDVLSLHALTLRGTVTLSFQYKCQTARCNVCIVEWATPVIDGLVFIWPSSWEACWLI